MTDSVNISVWGRIFSLPVVFDCYEGETITQGQYNALESFLSHKEWIEEAKQLVEAYCLEAVSEDIENEKKENIFSYIIPEAIFIKRDFELPRIALMCSYRYDPEHGLALVFTQDGTCAVGSQDIIL